MDGTHLSGRSPDAGDRLLVPTALSAAAAILLAAGAFGPWYAGPSDETRMLGAAGLVFLGGAALCAAGSVAALLARRNGLGQALAGWSSALVVLLVVGTYVERIYHGPGWTLFAWGFYVGMGGLAAALGAYFVQPVPSTSQYVLRRILLSVPVLFGITLVTFALSWAANEGNMERGYLTDKMTPAQRERIVEQYGFDEPWYVQYFNYLQRLVRLDLGLSHSQNDRLIMEVYKDFFPATLELSLAAMVVAITGGVFLGTLSAVRKDAPVDHATRFLALAGVSVPIFWLGLILKFVFSTQYPVELFTGAGPVGKTAFYLVLLLLPLLAGLFLAENLVSEELTWLRLAVHGAIAVALVGFLLWAGWFFAAVVLLAVAGAGVAIAGALKLVRRPSMPRRAWYALLCVIGVASVGLALSPVANAGIEGFFDLVPDFPLGSRSPNSLVFSHPSLTEGPTNFLVIDTLLARDWEAFNAVLLHLVLPAVTLGYASLAIIARMMRSSMLEVLSLDFVRTARAKGLPRSVVIRGHARRNALIPIATVIGLTFGGLLSGAVLTETIFQWPGIGRWSTMAIVSADTNSVMAFTLLVVVIYLFANLAVDVAYSILDPRVRLQ